MSYFLYHGVEIQFNYHAPEEDTGTIEEIEICGAVIVTPMEYLIESEGVQLDEFLKTHHSKICIAAKESLLFWY
jgi:hypothetical protein